MPEEVFAPDSLKSYKGAPVIVTHDAGLITKDNVSDEQIGTILSDGYRSGEDVRAEIIIHDTDALKSSGLRELSLGYNLELDETPGEWNGEPYDAVQRNIRINHLALVREARAGEQARLNIDSRDSALKGGKVMQKSRKKKNNRMDGILSPDELKKAIEEYKAHRSRKSANDEDDRKQTAVPPIPTKAMQEDDDDEDTVIDVQGDEDDEPATVEEQVQLVKDRRDRRDEEGDPKNLKSANDVIANQDEDIDILFDIIDTLLAQIAFDSDDEPQIPAKEDCDDTNEDGDDDEFAEDDEDFPEDEDEELNEDDDEDEELNEDDDEDDMNEDDDEDESASKVVPSMNKDGVDRIVRERVQIAKVASMLNLDGLEYMSPSKAKRKVIRIVKPGVRLDGKSKAYINAMFDLSCQEVQRRNRKDTMYQRKQMFNKDSRSNRRRGSSTDAARERMIKRMQNSK